MRILVLALPLSSCMTLASSQGLCRVVGLLGHTIVLLLVFKGIPILFSTILFSTIFSSGCINLHSHQSARGSPFPHTLYHLLFVEFLLMAILTCEVIVLICFSLIMSNVEHLFMCVLASCMSSLEKCLFRSSSDFLIGLFGFLVLNCILGCVLVVMSKMQETWVRSLGGKIPWRRKWPTHSSILAWKIPWTHEPGGLQSMGLQRVRHA